MTKLTALKPLLKIFCRFVYKTFFFRCGPQSLLVQNFVVKLEFTIPGFFGRTAVLRKIFDIRFPDTYKHCNFSCGCLPVKMASKTMIKSNLLTSTTRRKMTPISKRHTKFYELLLVCSDLFFLEMILSQSG